MHELSPETPKSRMMRPDAFPKVKKHNVVQEPALTLLFMEMGKAVFVYEKCNIISIYTRMV